MGGEKSKQTFKSCSNTILLLATASVGQSNGITSGQRIIQNFRLIWLDANIDESNDDFYNSITHLRHIVNTINIFTDADQCVRFLTQIKDEKTLLIISGALGQHTVPRIHDISQLDSIFVFCGNTKSHKQWAKDWSKVKGVYTKIGPICESLKQAARQCDRDTISIDFVAMEDSSRQNLDQLNQSFMYTQMFKEILLEIDYDEQFSKDLTTYCRDHFVGNDLELNNIEKFEREYRQQSPVWWYTYECFLYPMLNRALRAQEVDTILKMGFFIRDLHRQIEQLHSEQFTGQQLPFTVYRGQGLMREDFEKLIRTKGGLMSFNNFLSTSKDQNISLDFATRALTNPQQVGILFEMTIDPSISTALFALINEVSCCQLEQEILFSMHTIFRIGEIKKLDKNNRLWQVKLSLTSDNHPLLSALTKQMRKDICGSTGWSRLGDLLIILGEFDKAGEVYQMLDQKTSDDNDKAYLYNQLGYIKKNQGDYTEAISFYEKLLEIRQRTLPPDHPDLADIYNNIGLVYDSIDEYSKAYSFYERAVEISRRTLPPNHPHLLIYKRKLDSVRKKFVKKKPSSIHLLDGDPKICFR